MRVRCLVVPDGNAGLGGRARYRREFTVERPGRDRRELLPPPRGRPRADGGSRPRRRREQAAPTAVAMRAARTTLPALATVLFSPLIPDTVLTARHITGPWASRNDDESSRLGSLKAVAPVHVRNSGAWSAQGPRVCRCSTTPHWRIWRRPAMRRDALDFLVRHRPAAAAHRHRLAGQSDRLVLTR
jgi:hypothetical protein